MKKIKNKDVTVQSQVENSTLTNDDVQKGEAIDRVNEIIIKRFENILEEYQNASVEIKGKYLKSTLNKIIEPDMSLFDDYCEFYDKKQKPKEFENFLDYSKFVYDTSLEKITKEVVESYEGNNKKSKRASVYKFLAICKYEDSSEKIDFLQKIIQEEKKNSKN